MCLYVCVCARACVYVYTCTYVFTVCVCVCVFILEDKIHIMYLYWSAFLCTYLLTFTVNTACLLKCKYYVLELLLAWSSHSSQVGLNVIIFPKLKDVNSTNPSKQEQCSRVLEGYLSKLLHYDIQLEYPDLLGTVVAFLTIDDYSKAVVQPPPPPEPSEPSPPSPPLTHPSHSLTRSRSDSESRREHATVRLVMCITPFYTSMYACDQAVRMYVHMCVQCTHVIKLYVCTYTCMFNVYM